MRTLESLRAAALLTLLALLLAPGRPGRAEPEPELFRWQDKSGRLIFSDTAPADPRRAAAMQRLGGAALGARAAFEVPSERYVEQTLGERSFTRVKSALGTVQFELELPADWAQAQPQALALLERATRDAGTLVAAYFRQAESEPLGIPLIALLVDGSVRPAAASVERLAEAAPIFREHWLRKLFASGFEDARSIDSIAFDAASETLSAEFPIEVSGGERLQVMFGVHFTREGMIGLMAYSLDEPYASYRPLFLRVLRSLRVPGSLQLFPDAAEQALALPGSPLPAGVALGAAVALLSGLALLMVVVCVSGRGLQLAAAGALVLAAGSAAAAAARNPAELSEALLAFGVGVGGLFVLGAAARLLVLRPS